MADLQERAWTNTCRGVDHAQFEFLLLLETTCSHTHTLAAPFHVQLVSYAQAERAKVEAARAAEAGDAGGDDDGTEETVTLTLEELAQHMNLSDEDMAKFRAIASGQATMADVAGATETIAEGDEEEDGAAPATAAGAGGGAGADATS